jgi:hypothetical protein
LTSRARGERRSSPIRSRGKRAKDAVSLASRRPRTGAGCDHRRCSVTTVFTELGCHARCLACGALGPGCPDSDVARQSLLVPALTSTRWARHPGLHTRSSPEKEGAYPMRQDDEFVVQTEPRGSSRQGGSGVGRRGARPQLRHTRFRFTRRKGHQREVVRLIAWASGLAGVLLQGLRLSLLSTCQS